MKFLHNPTKTLIRL